MEKLNALLGEVPNWLVATGVLVLGWLAAGIVGMVVARLLRLFRFNHMCERMGAGEFLRKGEVSKAPSELVGRGLYWVILIAAFLEAAQVLQMRLTVEIRRRAMETMPIFLSALLVLVIGLVAVAFLAGFVRTLARHAGSPYANMWSRVTRWVGVMLVGAIALEQAQISASTLAGVIQIVIAAFAFGLALAFGLGCKDMARNAMEKWIACLKERHRDVSKSDLEG